jgi:hypothetical protein
MSPLTRALALRWLAVHLGISVAVELFFAIFFPDPFYSGVAGDGDLTVPVVVTQGLRVGLAQAFAFAWIGLPPRPWFWGIATCLAAGFGTFVGVRAERSLERLIFDVGYGGQIWGPTGPTYADFIIPFTQAFVIGATQGVLLTLWVDRRAAIVWGCIAAAAWFIIDVLFCLALGVEPLRLHTMKVWRPGEPSSQGLNGVWIALYSASLLPALHFAFRGHPAGRGGTEETPPGEGPTSTAPP